MSQFWSESSSASIVCVNEQQQSPGEFANLCLNSRKCDNFQNLVCCLICCGTHRKRLHNEIISAFTSISPEIKQKTSAMRSFK